MEDNIYTAVLKRKLVDLGFSIQDDGNDILRLNLNKDYSKTLTVKLIESQIIDESKQGSHNKTPIKSIGYFCFNFPPEGVKEPVFLIFAFNNTSDNQMEFIIIPKFELKRRLSKILSTNCQEIALRFWLLMDNCLYETTGISMEGEWFFLSQGLNGRMADSTDWDYTSFLNCWEILTAI